MKFKKSLILAVIIILSLPILTNAISPVRVGSSNVNITFQLSNTTGDFVDGCEPRGYFFFPENNQTVNNSIQATDSTYRPGQYNLTTNFAFSQTGTWLFIANCTDRSYTQFIPATDTFLVVEELPIDQYQNITRHTSYILSNLTSIMGNQTEFLNRFNELNLTLTDVIGNVTGGLISKLDNITSNTYNMQQNVTQIYHWAENINLTVFNIEAKIDIIDNNIDSLITDITTLIEFLDCDTVSDTPICQRVIDINSTVNSISNQTHSIFNFTDTLEVGQADLQANISTILNELGNITLNVTEIWTFTDTLETGQSSVQVNITTLLANQGNFSGNFTFIFHKLQDINQSIDNVEANTNTIITDISNLNFTTNLSFGNIENNLTNIYNDTQSILVNLNCTTASANYVCDRLNNINNTDFSLLSLLTDINAEVNDQQANLTRMLFLMETKTPKYNILTFKFGEPDEGWDNQYFLRLRQLGIIDSPEVELKVPVKSEEDLLVINDQDATIEFTFRKSLLGTNYITFRPTLAVCVERNDQDVYLNCKHKDYKLWTRNEIGGEIGLYDNIAEIENDMKLGKLKDLGAFFKKTEVWLISGFTTMVLFMLFIIFLLWEQKDKNKPFMGFKRRIIKRRPQRIITS